MFISLFLLSLFLYDTTQCLFSLDTEGLCYFGGNCEANVNGVGGMKREQRNMYGNHILNDFDLFARVNDSRFHQLFDSKWSSLNESISSTLERKIPHIFYLYNYICGGRAAWI